MRSAGCKQILRAARNKAEGVTSLRRSHVTQQHGKDAAACPRVAQSERYFCVRTGNRWSPFTIELENITALYLLSSSTKACKVIEKEHLIS